MVPGCWKGCFASRKWSQLEKCHEVCLAALRPSGEFIREFRYFPGVGRRKRPGSRRGFAESYDHDMEPFITRQARPLNVDVDRSSPDFNMLVSRIRVWGAKPKVAVTQAVALLKPKPLRPPNLAPAAEKLAAAKPDTKAGGEHFFRFEEASVLTAGSNILSLAPRAETKVRYESRF